MSLASFIPELFASNYEETFKKALVFGSFANRKYEGVISQVGDTVKVPFIGSVDVLDYDGSDITVQDLTGSTLDIKVDKQKYFAFNVGDVDRLQSMVNIEQAYGQRAAYEVANSIDTTIAALYTEAGSTVGSTASPVTITAATSTGANTNIYEAIGDIRTQLDNKNVPMMGRWLVLPSWAVQKLSLAGKTVLSTTDQGAYVNGIVTGANIDGFTIYQSNSVTNGSAAVASKIMAGTTDAIAMVSQLTMVRSVERELKFGALVKGLTVYGVKTVQPDALVCATWSYAAG